MANLANISIRHMYELPNQVHLNSMLDEARPHTTTIVDCLTNLTLSREATKQVVGIFCLVPASFFLFFECSSAHLNSNPIQV